MIVRTRLGALLSCLLVVTEAVLELIPEQSEAYSEGDHIQLKCSHHIPGENQALEIRFVKEILGPVFSKASVIQSTDSREDRDEEVLILEATSEQELKANDHGATIYCDLIRHDQILTREAKVINVTGPPEVVGSMRKGNDGQQVSLQVLSNPPIMEVNVFEISDEEEEEFFDQHNVSLETIKGAFVNVEINSTGNQEKRLAVYVNNKLGKTKFVFPDDSKGEAAESHNDDLIIEDPMSDELFNRNSDGQDSTTSPTHLQITSNISRIPGGPTVAYLATVGKSITMDCWANDESVSIVWKTPNGGILKCSFENCSGACKPSEEGCGYRLVHFQDNPLSFALVIDSVGSIDFGEWECRVEEDPLTVYSKATVFPDKPKLRILNEDGLGFISGQTIRYSCSYQSVVQVLLRWDHVADLLRNKRETPLSRDLHAVESLYNLDTRDEDFGTYVTCEADFPRIWNITDQVIASRRVQIKVIPKLWPKEDNIILFPSEYRAIIKLMAYPFPREENIFVMAGNMSVESWSVPNITKLTDHTGEIQLLFPEVSREWTVIMKNSVGQIEVTLNFKLNRNKDFLRIWWFWFVMFSVGMLLAVTAFLVYTWVVVAVRRRRIMRKTRERPGGLLHPSGDDWET